ncbi:hypothetical protein DV711_05950 [Motiliproteus coralliicola]|uniref:Transcriptional regulator SutA RNAP-binding domain-containing protein n=1 Tax=Motiliproteus coralliicola TaxID=2283196 RepID=A0A369WVM7_9GAMM|nr:hypothetical protein [Motiliproteus coralliicola]RDE25099.1 hypothetical protein DV711_05950 [Motiliproteus coralliicola]
MKHRPSKAEIRAELNQQVQEFLERGGQIKEFDAGVSGFADGQYHRTGGFIERPKDSRTPVNEVVARIESRRRSKHLAVRTQRNNKPQKKLLYDDFGEPLRWVWSED